MVRIYCKKVDLTIISKYDVKKIYDYCLYFFTNKEYTPLELEHRLVEEKDKIIEELEKRFKKGVGIHAKPGRVESIEVKKEWEGLLLTDKGCIPKKEVLFYV